MMSTCLLLVFGAVSQAAGKGECQADESTLLQSKILTRSRGGEQGTVLETSGVESAQVPNSLYNSCGIERSQTVYAGCGYTYQLSTNCNNQCGHCGTSRFIPNEGSCTPHGSCGIARSQVVFAGCGYTYQCAQNCQQQCGHCQQTRFIPAEHQEYEAEPELLTMSYDFSAFGLVYIKSIGGDLYLANADENRAGARGRLSACPKEENRPNCQWYFEPSRPSTRSNTWYLRASDMRMFARIADGVAPGHSAALQPCSLVDDLDECQWIIEQSPTNKQFFYIRAASEEQSLYLHAVGAHGPEEGAAITLDPCPKERDLPGCQWELEQSCQDHSEIVDCHHWARLGLCAEDEEIRNSCPLTCGVCQIGADHQLPYGEWVLLMSSTSGAVEYTITEGLSREDGQSLTSEQVSTVGRNMQERIQRSVGFSRRDSHSHSVGVGASVSTFAAGGIFGSGFGVGGGVSATVSTDYEYEHETETEHTVEETTEHTVGMSWEHTNRVAQEISHSITQSSQTTSTVSCNEADASTGRTKVWLYQWVIHDGGNVVRTAHTRCHYTAGVEHAPECPFTACGSGDNEWCELRGCDRWQVE